jgi:hypothetical protein
LALGKCHKNLALPTKKLQGTKESKCANNIMFFINFGFGKMP